MANRWHQIELTGGVVKTRDEMVLGNGELSAANGAMLKPNDLVQVHRDKGNTTLLSLSDVKDIRYINWENSSPEVLVLTDDLSNGELNTYDAATGTSGATETFTGQVTSMGVVHRGNEYFIGTSEKNLVLSESGGSPAFRTMGMMAGDENTMANRSYDFSTVAVSPASEWSDYDHVMYWWTEYDSTNDIESGPVMTNSFEFRTGKGGDNPKIDSPITLGLAKKNTNADKWRIYRAYMGNKGSNDGVANASVAAQTSWKTWDEFLGVIAGRGGLVAEIDYDVSTLTYTDTLPGKLDPSIPWPQIFVNSGSVTYLYEKLVKPKRFDVGVLWNDSLVVNDLETSDQVLRFSPPGLPEYQPTPYLIYFATENSDEIVGLAQVNGRLVVLMTGSVWRVNYLPFEGFVASIVGKVQEQIVGGEGCINKKAYRVVEGEQGDLVVWVSPLGLRASTGQGWVDICPDWDVESAGIQDLSSVVLHDNRALYRLELYDGNQRHDFYYHPSLLKNGKFRYMGPTTMNNSILAGTGGELSGSAASWIAADSIVMRQNLVGSANPASVTTGLLTPENPMREINIESVALTHTAQSNATGKVTITTKFAGEPESSATVSLDMSEHETTDDDTVGGGISGNWARLKVEIGGTGDVSFGPLWVKAGTSEDGNG